MVLAILLNDTPVPTLLPWRKNAKIVKCKVNRVVEVYIEIDILSRHIVMSNLIIIIM